jgi:putative ABC transport system ATP-binding protein
MTTAPLVSATRDTVAIRAESLHRHYKMGDTLVRALDGVSLEVRSGEFVALLGTSGSGKSSMLNLIAGLDRPTSGSVSVQDRDLAKLSREDLAKYRLHVVGMVFQTFNLIASMTLTENVELPLRFAEVDRRERDDKARTALERVGLRARLHHRPSEISGGEQQRAALARALINRPQLLLADEPTGNLDSTTSEEIMRVFEGLAEQGQTVIMVTHEPDIAAHARRVIVLRDGSVASDDKRATFIKSAGIAPPDLTRKT